MPVTIQTSDNKEIETELKLLNKLQTIQELINAEDEEESAQKWRLAARGSGSSSSFSERCYNHCYCVGSLLARIDRLRCGSGWRSVRPER